MNMWIQLVFDCFARVVKAVLGSPPRVSGIALKRDPNAIPFGGLLLPRAYCHPHFLFWGAPGTGKSTFISIIAKAVLTRPGEGLVQRAVVFDFKKDAVPMLIGMGVPPERITTLDPIDSECSEWLLGADCDRLTLCDQFAAHLAPVEPGTTQPFFAAAAQGLVAATMKVLHHKAEGRWGLHDVVVATEDTERLKAVLSLTEEGRIALDKAFAREELTKDVLAELETKMKPFRAVSRLWARTTKPRVSLARWIADTEPTVLVLRAHADYDKALAPLNRLVFERVLSLLVARPVEYPPDETWLFFDEFRWSGLPGEDLSRALLTVRSKGGHFVLGAQDKSGPEHRFARALAAEISAAAGNTAFLGLTSPETRTWASEFIGSYEDWVAQHSDSAGSNGRSSSTSHTLQLKPAVLPQEFARFPPATLETGMSGIFTANGLPPWHSHVSPEFLARYRPVPAATVTFTPRSADDEEPIPYDTTLVAELLRDVGRTTGRAFRPA